MSIKKSEARRKERGKRGKEPIFPETTTRSLDATLKKQGRPIEKKKEVGGFSSHFLPLGRRHDGLRVRRLNLGVLSIRNPGRRGSHHGDGGAEELDRGVLGLGHVLCAVQSLLPRIPTENRIACPPPQRSMRDEGR